MPKQLQAPKIHRAPTSKSEPKQVEQTPQNDNNATATKLAHSGGSLKNANPNTILQLQTMFGNQAVLGMIQREGGDNENKKDEKSAPPDPLNITLSSSDYSMCMEIYKKTQSWDALKSMYVSSDTPDLMLMAKLWKFRRDYVVGLIKSLRDTKYPDLLAKSVGSNDLTSDYDVTLASPGSGNDVEAISDFNNHVKGQFGVQSGTLFDTNLYARDFAPVDQSKEFKEADETYPTDDSIGGLPTMSEMEGDIEDVGALIKVRRYMSQTEWDAHVTEIVNGVETSKREAVERRYDEADALYQIATANLLQRLKESLGEVDEDLDDQIDTYESDTVEDDTDDKSELQLAQEMNADELSEIEHHNSDLVLEKSNEIYLERMRVIRQMQQDIAKLQNELDTLGSKDINSDTLDKLLGPKFSGLFTGMINNAKARDLPKIIDAKQTQIKQLMSEAIFYAAEAYTSEGAIMHIVAGIQGSKLTDEEKLGKNEDEQQELLAQKMQEANDKLTLDHLLQSVNEQFGDFMKDYGHLARKTEGTMYIKSSKYVDRMLDAIDILVKRDADTFADPANEAVTAAFEIGDLTALRAEIKKLYYARKDPTMWGDEREDTAKGVMSGMGINNRAEYKAAIMKLGAQINIVLRNQIDLASDEQEKRYFKNLNTDKMKDLD